MQTTTVRSFPATHHPHLVTAAVTATADDAKKAAVTAMIFLAVMAWIAGATGSILVACATSNGTWLWGIPAALVTAGIAAWGALKLGK